MITVTIFRSATDVKALTLGFEIKGHAGYSEYGSDIVCSAVSVLYINTCNSLEKFLGLSTDVICKGSNDKISKLYVKDPDSDAELLLKSLELGINNIAEEYSDFVKVVYKID